MSPRLPPAARRRCSISIGRPPPSSSSIPPPALTPKLSALPQNFGLTIAETRVLGEIVGGNGLLAAAAKLKITEATARSHTNHILAKTGTTRQTELIRRFFETVLPAWRLNFQQK